MKFRNPLVNLSELAGQITTGQLEDGAVTEPKIGALAVTGPKVSPLAIDTGHLALLAVEADRLADAAVESAKLATSLQSDNFVSGSAGWYIGRGSGSAEFNNVTVRGVIIVGAGSDLPATYISSGNISAASITLSGTGSIASSNYVAGVAGFAIDGSGNAEFNDVTVRGTIEVGAGSDVPATYISTGTISAATITLSSTAGVLQSSNFVAGSAGFRVRGNGDAEFNNVTVRGTIYATAGELGDLDITGTLEMAAGAKLITNATSGARLELAGGTSSNSLQFFSESSAGEYSPSYLAVTDWGASGFSITMGAGQSDSGDGVSQLTLAPKDFAAVVNYGAALSAAYSHLILSSAAGEVKITGSSDITFTTTGSGDVYNNPNGDVRFSPGGHSIFESGDVKINAGRDLFTHKVHTGGLTWTREPWSSSTIELGNYGAVGTQGSYGLYLAWNWERGTDSGYYTKSVNSHSEAGYIGIKSDGITFGFDISYGATGAPSRLFRFDTDNIGQSRMYGNHDAEWFEIDHDNGWFQWFIGSQEQMRLDDNGSLSALNLNDGLTNVGNHEVLRLDRGSGTIMRAVGYYSSFITDPDTGKVQKRAVVPLASHRSNRHWRREWFLDLEPIKYDRPVKREPQRPGYKQRELGFSIENLIEHTNLLTTKGSEVGGSPDEYALLAVTVDYVQSLEARIADLEALLSAA